MSEEKVININPNSKKTSKLIGAVVVLALIALVGSQSFFIVGAGHQGVVLNLGAVQPNVMDEGIHLRIPFIQQVVPVEVRVQKAETSQTAASRDLQIVTTTVAVNFHINGKTVNKLYQQVGLEYKARIVDPAIAEALKAVTARYTAEELISKRAEISIEVKETLASKLSVYNMVLDEINITEFKFSDEYNNAIEQKQIAEQQALKAQLDLQRIRIEKEQQITKAQAQAESLKLQKMEVTPELIELRKIEAQLEAIKKWDGKLPNVTSDTVPFIQVEK